MQKRNIVDRMAYPDKAGFLKLIQENKGIIFKICNAYCYSRGHREDLAQEIIYQLWKSGQNFNPDFKFSTWMYRVALNVAISFYRKEKSSGDVVSLSTHIAEIEMKEDDTEKETNILLLQQFINELKPLDRALMILYLESKSYSEIAEILGITETNVATKINRIKNNLKQKFSTIKE